MKTDIYILYNTLKQCDILHIKNIVFTTIHDYVYSMVRALSKTLNLFLTWSHMDFWQQTKIDCHYILTIILHLISLSQNIATFLLNNEYFLELSIGNTTVAPSGAKIAYPPPPEYMSSYPVLFRFHVDSHQFSVFSTGKLCLPMSLSIIVFVVVSWFLVFNHVFSTFWRYLMAF